ncbi:hypothetical protein LZ554_001854 [Drepanopeziza brunnea f. sp. 'monogermtubi']|nr:hypothetical protein LZ554_001854 [Drepanopeziza brunnea f. sp. 'monogermtubi']
MIPEDIALLLNKDESLSAADEYAGETPTQLGRGLELVSDARLFLPKERHWYCAILAKRDKLKSVGKVYIPAYDPEASGTGALWNAQEATIRGYILAADLVSYPNTALRFSWIRGVTDQLLMVIPSLVIEINGLGTKAKCYQTKEKLVSSYKKVEWDSWDIKGELGSQRP